MNPHLANTNDETRPTEKMIIHANHPPLAVFRSLRDWIPVELSKLWVSILCFILEISFAVTTSIESGQVKTIWGLVILVIEWVLFSLSEDDTERFPIYGVLVFDAWFLYGLLPWSTSTYIIPQYVVAGACPVLTLIFFMAAQTGDLAGGYILFAQILLLIYPVKLSAVIEPAELWVQVLFFGLGWCTYLLVTNTLHGKVKLENVFMATLPLLRLQGASVLLYIVILESSLALQCYTAVGGSVPTPLQTRRVKHKSGPSQGFDEEDEVLGMTNDDLEVQHEGEEQEVEEHPEDQTPFLKQQPVAKAPPPAPAPPTITVQKPRFKVGNMVQTHHKTVTFSPKVTTRQEPQKIATPPPINISATPGTEIERLGGNHLKDVYRGKP